MPDRIHWTVEPISAATEQCQDPSPRGSTDEIFGVALSGGGSRAAVYGAAGLEALWEHGLIDRISHISSVSGGSIAAAYFVANHPACHEETAESAADDCWRDFFTGFKQAMRYNFTWATELRQIARPNRWFSPTRRASSFREVLDRQFLNGQTFGELAASGSDSVTGGPDAPVLLINGTSFDEARGFVFSNLCVENPAGVFGSASFSRPGCQSPVPRNFPISLAVTASAAFPGLFGPVTLEAPPSCNVPHPEWWHVGDAGMIDNSGSDTLEQVVLSAVEAGDSSPSRALLVAFDADQHSRGELVRRKSNYRMMTRDPNRIAWVTKARGRAYHDIVWARLKRDMTEQDLRVEEFALRYSEAELESWPKSCWSGARGSEDAASQVEKIRQRLEKIPTLLNIDNCGADLLERAAHQLVHETLNSETGRRARELGIPVREALCTNTELAIDELNFPQGSSLLSFENVTAEVLGELEASHE